MFRQMAIALVLTAAVAHPGPGLPIVRAKTPDAAEFLRAAVYDGLAADGVSPDLARELAHNPDFIKGCKICAITHTAIAEYSQLAKAPPAKPGRGLANETVKKLQSRDDKVRLAAMRDLISRYMGFAYDRANLPTAVRSDLERQVKSMALKLKDPDGPLPGNMPFCPSCDGACKKPPALISQ